MRGIKPRYKIATIALLGGGDFSAGEIAAKMPCSLRTAYLVIEHLKVDGLIHVCCYKPHKTRPMAVLRLGAGADAPRPVQTTAAERMRKYRHKMSADDRDFLKARRRQRSRTIKIDPLTAAFFGVKR